MVAFHRGKPLWLFVDQRTICRWSEPLIPMKNWIPRKFAMVISQRNPWIHGLNHVKITIKYVSWFPLGRPWQPTRSVEAPLLQPMGVVNIKHRLGSTHETTREINICTVLPWKSWSWTVGIQLKTKFGTTLRATHETYDDLCRSYQFACEVTLPGIEVSRYPSCWYSTPGNHGGCTGFTQISAHKMGLCDIKGWDCQLCRWFLDDFLGGFVPLGLGNL